MVLAQMLKHVPLFVVGGGGRKKSHYVLLRPAKEDWVAC
jgi:hypothetical protein